jgi:hypothetical protein
MTVLLRTKRAQTGRQRRKQTARPAMRHGGPPEPVRLMPVGRRHAGPPPQDRAVYSCACGLVFQAHVSTSVACPHCGQPQAW